MNLVAELIEKKVWLVYRTNNTLSIDNIKKDPDIATIANFSRIAEMEFEKLWFKKPLVDIYLID